MSLNNPKTKEVLKWFTEITKIPRCSKKEEKIRKWLVDWSKEHSLDYKTDEAGNVVIKVPGTPGYEKSAVVVIQGHMDMVCEKTPDSTHDFSKDPIGLVYDGDWLKADKTTLGADNGIAIALALAIALDRDVAHPPLELLFTVDEETGLTGANKLGSDFIEGRVLLNVDSEDEGVFTIGCAGGVDADITIPLSFEDAPAGMKAHVIKAGGMKGGHSGVDIHKQRANAIRVLARALGSLSEKHKLALADIKGGSAHNAIPRDAEATVFLESGDLDKIRAALGDFEKVLRSEYANVEPDLTLSVAPAGASGKARVMSAGSMKKAVSTILAMPHGVAAMATAIQGLVETSNNLATVRIEDSNLRMLSSQRSSVLTRLAAITDRIKAVAELAGGKAHVGEGYPPWEPNWNSALLKKCKAIYKSKFGRDPVVEVIHAGLECGIIGDKYEGMDMISFGPTIRNPHSPDECLKVTDIEKIWDFTSALFKELR